MCGVGGGRRRGDESKESQFPLRRRRWRVRWGLGGARLGSARLAEVDIETYCANDVPLRLIPRVVMVR